MPRIDPIPPPRPVPIRILLPGQRFALAGSALKGTFVEMVGHDAKVVLDDARQAVYWSDASPVFRDGNAPVAPPTRIESGPSRAERKEAQAKVERVMARPSHAPVRQTRFVGEED